MSSESRSRLKEWLARGEARLEPLTFPQREIYETSPVAPGDPANNIGCYFEITGPITYEQCCSAVSRVVARQEAMRTSLLPTKDGAVQLIRSKGETVMEHHELDGSVRSHAAMEEVLLDGFRKPFDMVGGPLYRMEMHERGPGDFVTGFTIHHAVADGWTLGTFIQDLFTAYILEVIESGKSLDQLMMRGVRDELPEVPMTYAAWGASERKRWTRAELDRHVDFWKPLLENAPRVFGDEPTAADVSGPLEKRTVELPLSLAEAAKDLAKRSGVTLFSTLLSVFQLTLNRWSGLDDFVVGSPVANRNKVSLGETMGYFSGIVPLRGQIDRTRSFADRLKMVHEETIDCMAHAMPFAELAKALGEPAIPGRHAVFDTRFALQNHPVPDIELQGISTRLRNCTTGTARFDLGCELTEMDDVLELVWLNRPSVIDGAQVEELDRLFRQVLETVCREPEIKPSAMSV